MRNDECLAFVHAIVLTNNGGPLHESYPPEGMIFFIQLFFIDFVGKGRGRVTHKGFMFELF